MTYRTRCRRTALQRMRTVRPTVADRRVQNLERLMQAGRSSSEYPPAMPDFALYGGLKSQIMKVRGGRYTARSLNEAAKTLKKTQKERAVFCKDVHDNKAEIMQTAAEAKDR